VSSSLLGENTKLPAAPCSCQLKPPWQPTGPLLSLTTASGGRTASKATLSPVHCIRGRLRKWEPHMATAPRPAPRRILQLSPSAQAPERFASPLHSLCHRYVACTAFMLPRPSCLTMSLPSLLLGREEGQILGFFTLSSSSFSDGTQHPCTATVS